MIRKAALFGENSFKVGCEAWKLARANVDLGLILSFLEQMAAIVLLRAVIAMPELSPTSVNLPLWSLWKR